MGQREGQKLRQSVIGAFVGAMVIVSFAFPCHAAPGNFWYGLYNVQRGSNSAWGDTVWRAMSRTYKMNWALAAISDSDCVNGHVLDSARAAGIHVMQWAVCDTCPLGSEKALIYNKYSNCSYLTVQAEPDTVLWYWDAYEDPYTQQWRGVFTRYRPCDGGLTRCSVCSSCCGGPVYDPLADNDSAFLFQPYAGVCEDSIFTHFYGDIARVPGGRAFAFDFRIRATTGGCTGELARLVIRRNVKPHWWDPDTYWADLADSVITCAQLSDGAYHTFSVTAPQGENWWLHAFVFWSGKAPLWVDWIRVHDDNGSDLMSGSTDAAIQQYVQRYSFNNDPTIIGYYMAEELWEDANVLPQVKISQLVRQTSSALTPFTEHHYVSWWEHRHRYGGRNTASALLEQPYGVPTSGIFYSFTGYHFRKADVRLSPWASASVDTVKAVTGVEVCEADDTSLCLQERLKAMTQEFGLYKGMAVSTGVKFVPFLQAYSREIRVPPDTCTESSDPPWMVEHRTVSKGEAKVQASLALAYGANGLLYWVFGTHPDEYVTVYVPCDSGRVDTLRDWHASRYYCGFVDLPGVKDALHSYVGPLVDSLGSLFYSLQWKGAGRIDPHPVPDTGAVAAMVDSARSLTFTQAYDSAFVEAGVFEDAASQYLMLVNRRAYDAAAQDVRVWLNRSAGMYYVIDAYTYDTVLTGALPNGTIPFTTTIPPGEAKLFKVVPVGASYVSGSGLPQKWEGGIRIGGNVAINSGRTLTVHSPADIRVIPGGSYVLTAYGSLVVNGTATDPVVFRADTSAPWNFAWYGIKQAAPGDLSMQYALVKQAYMGVRIADTTQVNSSTLDHCEFRDCTIGIWIESDTASPVSITNSRFHDMDYYGINIYKGKATIQNNRFTGTFDNGIRLEGYMGRKNGGIIEGNSFDSMFTAGCNAIYLQTVHDDTRNAAASERLLDGNTIGPYWWDTTSLGLGQAGIYINNCTDAPLLYKNSLSCIQSPYHEPQYGILNFSTATLLYGDATDAGWHSRIYDFDHGIYCANAGAGDSDTLKVRQCDLYFNRCNVYLTSYGRVDLGKLVPPADSGKNALWCETSQLNIDNHNASFTVPAKANWWWNNRYGAPYVQGSVNTTNRLTQYPFWGGPYGEEKIVAEGSPLVEPECAHDLIVSYPNPFNSSTVIQFGMSQGGALKVTIYNV